MGHPLRAQLLIVIPQFKQSGALNLGSVSELKYGYLFKACEKLELKIRVPLAREPERVADARKARRGGEKKEKNLCIKIFKGQG